ncbi:MAG: signal peptidase I [Bacteroidales bacterium]|jgi:signal peptidase I|nr:signal peptidase I [Bacteroidales bacterium]
MNISPLFLLVYTIICFVGTFIGLYGVFQKAGKKGYLALIPFYNLYVWLKVIERSWKWLLFFLIPYFGLFMLMLMTWKTLRMFNKTRYITLIPGTFFSFVYVPYLGFSSKEKFYTKDELPAMKLGIWTSTPINAPKHPKEKQDEKRKTVKTKARSWCDDIIYAITAVYILRAFFCEFYAIPTSSEEGTLMVGDYLVVSKITYGPKIPQTFIAIPFVHHTFPLTKYTKSYWDKVRLPMIRLKGFHAVERNDAVVFNYPDGDTVILERQNESYYAIVRNIKNAFQNPQTAASQYYYSEEVLHQYGELFQKYGADYYQGKEYDVIAKEYRVRARPIDKRENYVKRCVAIRGDKLEIKNAILYINDRPAYQPPKGQMMYCVQYNGYDVSESNRKKLDINEEDRVQISYNQTLYHLNKDQVEKIASFPNIVSVTPQIYQEETYEEGIFPQDSHFRWNRDNFGPIVIPEAGATVMLNDSTLPLYKRIIEIYENNSLETKDGKIFINGKETNNYTFKMNYYWMMGDNRHNSADSRYWGFVPEDHVVGKVSFAWLSLDKFKNWGEGKIRWNRMFRKVR